MRTDITQHSKGFTLIEIIITILIMSIMAGIFINFFSVGADTFSLIDAQQELNQSGRIILERMGRKLREATYDPANYPVTVEAGNTKVTFYHDMDGDGTPDKTEYYKNGSNLCRDINDGGEEVLLDNISGVAFTKQTTNGVLVKITLTLISQGLTKPLQTAVLLRQSLP